MRAARLCPVAVGGVTNADHDQLIVGVGRHPSHRGARHRPQSPSWRHTRNDCELWMLRGSRKGPGQLPAAQVGLLLTRWPVRSDHYCETVNREHAEVLQYHALPIDDRLHALNIRCEAAGLRPLSDEYQHQG